LNREPGIVVSSTEEHSGKYRVFGLRDPLASDPAVIKKEVKLEPGSVVLQLEPYHSLYPKFVFKRIKKILMPPETVTLELKNGILHAQGAALHQWIVEARELVKTIPGIVQYQDNKVIDIDQRLKLPETVNLELKNGILHAEGLALHQWIVEAGELAKTIPGVVQLQDDKVIDIDQDVEIAKKKVEEQIVFFRLPGINIVSGQGDTLRELLENISKLNYLAQFLDKKINIDIVGHTDSFGTAEENKDISLRRAQKIFSMLDWHDFKKTNFTAIGVGSKEPIKKENTEQDRLFNRSVTFRVSLSDNLPADKLDLKP
jgi:OOP family OmpA-OmpF porin